MNEENRINRTSRIKTYSVLFFITIACKLIGFARESVLAFFWGTGTAVDSLKMAESLSSVITGWMVAFSSVFVPMYSFEKEKNGQIAASKYMRQLLSAVSIIAFFFVAISLLLSGAIVDFGAFGFPESQRQLTKILYRICVSGYLIYAQISIMNNYLNCEGRFNTAAISTLLVSSIQILFIVVSYYAESPVIMGFGVAASFFARYIFLKIKSHSGPCFLGFNHKYLLPIKDVTPTLLLAVPLFLSEIVVSLNEFIDNAFASRLPEGSVSVLSYANILSTSFYSLITSSILTVFYALISKRIANSDKDGEIEELRYTMDLLLIILIPFSVFSIVFSKWGIGIVYERGAFTYDSTLKTALAFAIYISALPAISLRNICVQFYQAHKRTAIPLILSITNIIINVILNFLLVARYGFVGLAIATTASYFILVPVEFTLIKKILPDFSLSDRFKLFVRILYALVIPVLVSIVCVHFMNSLFFTSSIVVKVILLVFVLALACSLFAMTGHMTKLFNIKNVIKKIRSFIKGKLKNE